VAACRRSLPGPLPRSSRPPWSFPTTATSDLASDRGNRAAARELNLVNAATSPSGNCRNINPSKRRRLRFRLRRRRRRHARPAWAPPAERHAEGE